MREFTRRELFQRFRKNTAKTASETIHTFGLLSGIKSSSGKRDSSTSANIEVADGCSGCEVCAKICPEGALKWSSCGKGKQLQFEPRLCDACGTCTDACRQKAIRLSSALSPDRPISRENRTVITVSAFKCSQCSIKSFSSKGENICFVCKFRSMRKGGVKCSA